MPGWVPQHVLAPGYTGRRVSLCFLTAGPKARSNCKSILKESQTSVLNTSQNKQGYSKMLPSPAQPAETFCPSAVFWKMFPPPNTASSEQGHRPQSQTSSSTPVGESEPGFLRGPGWSPRPTEGPDQAGFCFLHAVWTLQSLCHVTFPSVGEKMCRKPQQTGGK